MCHRDAGRDGSSTVAVRPATVLPAVVMRSARGIDPLMLEESLSDNEIVDSWSK